MKFSINNPQNAEIEATRAKRKVKNDIIFISALLLLFCAIGLAMFLFKTVGDTVVVTVDGKLWNEYPLNEDREVEIRNGDGYNILVIKDGKAYVSSASCPDGICSSHRPVKHDGESIICLPNKVIVEIRKQSQNQPDIIS